MLQVRYLPNRVGVSQTATLILRSKEIGEWIYHLSGMGKPPLPMSPVMVECPVNQSTSGSVTFSNPFQSMTKFEVAISEKQEQAFLLLSKSRYFTLGGFGESHMISFAFLPKSADTFSGILVVSTVGLPEKIQWTWAIIGNTELSKQTLEIRGKAGTRVQITRELKLAAESEPYQVHDYGLTIVYPKGYDWLNKYVMMRIDDVRKITGGSLLTIEAIVNMRRQIRQSFQLTIANPFGQRWDFLVELNIDPPGPTDTISLAANLKECARKRLTLHEPFAVPTLYHVYFAEGSAKELSVSPTTGFIEPGSSELPFEIQFLAMVYGKVMKGLLVLDTLEVQWMFEVIGKVPDYVPPVVLESRIDKMDVSEMRAKSRRG
jgi:hypothetical protein